MQVKIIELLYLVTLLRDYYMASAALPGILAWCLHICLRAFRVHLRADLGSCERAVMGLESLSVLAGVTKHFVTVFSKTCNNP